MAFVVAPLLPTTGSHSASAAPSSSRAAAYRPRPSCSVPLRFASASAAASSSTRLPQARHRRRYASTASSSSSSSFIATPLSNPYSSSNHTLTTCSPTTNNNNHTTRAAPRMLVIEAGSVSDMDTILDGADDSLVVVDYSTSWCGPCKIFTPIFEELSEKYKDVVFVKVMGDATPEASELMKREGIRAVPAFHFWKNKKRVKDITGARRDDVESAITEMS